METGVEDNEKEQYQIEEEMAIRNLKMFPYGRNYVLSSLGFLRLFTILICFAAFIVNETITCIPVELCYLATYRYFSAISFLIFATSTVWYVLYISGFVQGLKFHPRVKAILEITYFGTCIFLYFFASAFLIPRTNGIAGLQVSSALGVFTLILITVHLALLLYHTNRQSAVTYGRRSESSCNSEDEETADTWIATTANEHNEASAPRLHSIRLKCSSIESVNNPAAMEEVDLTDSPVFADEVSAHSCSLSSSSSSSSSSCATMEGSWKVVNA